MKGIKKGKNVICLSYLPLHTVQLVMWPLTKHLIAIIIITLSNITKFNQFFTILLLLIEKTSFLFTQTKLTFFLSLGNLFSIFSYMRSFMIFDSEKSTSNGHDTLNNLTCKLAMTFCVSLELNKSTAAVFATLVVISLSFTSFYICFL